MISTSNPTLVCSMRSFRGERTKATNEVEKSISNRAMSPSLDSDTFEKGSVVYMRYPRDVAI